MATQVKKAKETKLLSARELAQKAGVSPAVLRKLLRKEFNRAGKVLVEGNRSEYRFNLSDPVTKQVIARTKELKDQPKEPQVSEETSSEPVVEEKSNED
jgi:DNA-binding transcriptional regulator YhcF (GntR family)